MQEVDERYLIVETENNETIEIFEDTIDTKFVKREAADDK